MAVFQVNLGHLVLPFSFFCHLFYRRSFLDNRHRFSTGQMSFLATNQPCQTLKATSGLASSFLHTPPDSRKERSLLTLRLRFFTSTSTKTISYRYRFWVAITWLSLFSTSYVVASNVYINCSYFLHLYLLTNMTWICCYWLWTSWM